MTPELIRPIEMTVTLRNNLVKARRLERGWTQRQLAQQAKVSAALVSHLETFRLNGRFGSPPVRRIASALGCEIGDLVRPWMDEVRKPSVTRLLNEEEIPLVQFSEARGLPAPQQADEVRLKHERNRQVELALATLTEREARVVRLSFGLDDGDEWTNKQIGKVLGCSGSRINQIRTKAMRKLRLPARRALVKDCL